ncbi:uroporphyrinogen decarboxylase family protein [Oceanispirochaeta sp.]|jgi:MtaA/CmuA family methyltransferase|uniref:uroporphyrinogen decarboxylase family protein n=1 Tax=Oceanispirochaeta sp. TaxID=2035350 RepID=UPI0026057B03|nr:uroporphyrinogen decarboxylase family protein [Oceanispirochaeta sp.]MDA3955909.1 uroporphyrinogen decarboxylase family protein [Oceanispirochaeta sp.]
MNGRERIKHFLRGNPVDSSPCMPITMMFAADLISESYKKYATDAKTHVKGQVAVAEAFDLDYVSAISDPATEAHDWGAEVIWFDDQPPATNEAHALISDKSALLKLIPPDPYTGKRMSNRLEVVSGLKAACGDTRLIEGWVEGPAAEASDLRGINHIMLDCMDDPSFVSDMFALVNETAIKFALAQIEAGADIIGFGDAAASLFGPALYEELIWEHEKKLVEAIHKAGALARLHICGNTSSICKMMAATGADILDIDSLVTPEDARRETGPEAVLLGFVDPVRILMNGNKRLISKELEVCRDVAGPRFIYGAGCEVPRGTPHRNLKALVQFAREN